MKHSLQDQLKNIKGSLKNDPFKLTPGQKKYRDQMEYYRINGSPQIKY